MTIQDFKNKMTADSVESAEYIIKKFDLKERARISSEDCDIEDYDNLSRVFEIEAYKAYVIIAESSEIDHIEFCQEFDSALKIATDFCAR